MSTAPENSTTAVPPAAAASATTTTTTSAAQFPPRLHNEVYPFIAPARFRGTLTGRTVLITGAAGTLGSALAECFATAGASLVLTYNRTPLSDALRQRCLELGAAHVRLAQCNVSEIESCERMIKEVLASDGTEAGKEGRVDVLVNNAGSNDLNPVRLQPILLPCGLVMQPRY